MKKKSCLPLSQKGKASIIRTLLLPGVDPEKFGTILAI